VLLRSRAEDLVSIANRIAQESVALDDITGGDFCFGLMEFYYSTMPRSAGTKPPRQRANRWLRHPPAQYPQAGI